MISTGAAVPVLDGSRGPLRIVRVKAPGVPDGASGVQAAD